ncbi:Sterol-4-alpha-carboxylate 3-dehydrogenase, decarboxylating [Fulvia fulva]|uniref:Sterol-4-alpha-carboxylate 3-dehydrogenase, decarboxylating n=1 Tax=Passalora fulva TaxID=5499 RepID=A0A9Q8PIC7_PASFU|nr:Sterol-4-alpha-carboxylate 3-dehydrogenase, decarboxylating [Fulvia fulva]KAK4615691.1 Sterol-4-alpha-carboxylate 3-dehydrogenase, decarboxylating [Fulvia fulva]KAK4616899.1 Sterol-4-alpha-carboxylate 3-dehydrogenase, decarboxylating [Fulvia fulva]UJO22972.1 Sterol-4-alpha-carboxylate 3-dehydrogenase, decarboxylating [Fulvia fulva]WPV18890.1 Sterol-4-alpha-carboxylate 3-dehydrogenase, decarboxylating [Fulvia fulva]WPV34586.1 Sterol-4-alpha-carboxylate 3-dehydrogenase, decarboxylating [Fulvi
MALEDAKDILVTGGSGYLGRGIVRALLDRYPAWNITILDLQPPDEDVQNRIAAFVQADITSEDSVKKAFANLHPELVVHTAGIVPARTQRYSTNSRQWEKVKAINYDGTRHVVDAMLAGDCRKLVFTSSCTVVVDDLKHDYYHMDETTPLGLAHLHYGKSKGLAEQYVLSSQHQEKGLTACALRPCTIIGPGDRAVVSIFYDCIAKRETYFIVGDGDNIYDFMYIDNAVDAHILAIENLLTTQTAAGEAMFISNQEPIYFWDFLAFVWAQFGHVPAFRIYIPMQIAWFLGLILEMITFLTGTASTLDTGSVADGVRTQYSNNEKAQRILGYYPKVGISEGVRRACEEYKVYLTSEASKRQSEKI